MRTRQLVNVERRFETGIIATLTDGSTTHSRHFTGVGREATRAICDYCDRNGLQIPEQRILGQIGRMDLLEGRRR